MAIAYKHVQEQPPPPSTVNPSVPVSLEAIDMRLLRKDPAQRYPSAEDLRADLRRFLEGHPVSALGAAAAAGVAAGAVADATVAVPAAAAAPPVTGAVPTYNTGEDQPKKRTGLYVGLLVLLLLLVAGILFFVGRNLGASTKQVTVPNVINTAVADATNTLQAAGFKVQTTTQVNDTVAEGQVFDQNPKANVKADEGSVVEPRRQCRRGQGRGPQRGGQDAGPGHVAAHQRRVQGPGGAGGE